MPDPPVSASDQDYLRAIYDAGGHERRVGTGELASQLDITQGAVTVALQRLHQKGLVDYRRYQGAQLTEVGERHALEMVRHHRLIERFLVEFLDYDWNDVHEEADRLEHVISEEMERRRCLPVDGGRRWHGFRGCAGTGPRPGRAGVPDGDPARSGDAGQRSATPAL